MAVSAGSVERAPHELDLVIDFVNTFDPDTDVDELADPHGLSAWLAQHRLLERRAPGARERDRREAIELREALRAVMLEHNGHARARGSSAVFEQVARHGRLSAHFADSGAAVLEPEARGVAAALALLLIPVFESSRDGSWKRVKACRADDCHWAFFDRSRNRSATWCDMAVCGNRAKVRSYRGRRAAPGPPRASSLDTG
jgi:predicted RNA-binding Zn ribbon-like protein